MQILSIKYELSDFRDYRNDLNAFYICVQN